jgi:hypothetical protein
MKRDVSGAREIGVQTQRVWERRRRARRGKQGAQRLASLARRMGGNYTRMIGSQVTLTLLR